MTKYILIISLFTLTIISCKSTKYPTSSGEFTGTLKSCSLDTMVYLNDSILILIDTDVNENLNLDCKERPEFTKPYLGWPNRFLLYFKNKQFIISYKPTKIKESSIALSVDNGTLEYDKKNKIITLHSIVFNWTRKFKVEYFKSEKKMVLRQVKI
jgi:hypothetical protein